MLPHFQTLLPKLEKALTDFSIPAQPANLYDPIRYFLQLPGKRVRPIFVLMSLELFRSVEDGDLGPSLATELFHNFSLVHDDIMDKADLRRGFQTVHKKWNEPTALLAGDSLLIFAYQALVQSNTNNLVALIQRFNEMSLAVCEGQQLDMDFSEMELVSVDQYLEMIDRKTGALIAFSFEMGGFLGNASDEERLALHQFGHAMGRCFQLRDDYLDLFGNEQLTGKKRGGDIGNSKLTYPVLLSLPHADFQAIWNRKPTDSESRIQDALRWMESNGISLEVEKLIASEMAIGMELLNHMAGHAEAKSRIEEVCKLLAYRDK